MTSPVLPRQRSAISTPDRRLRVFLSSTLLELAPEREAARDAVRRLRLTPVMFETGARPHPPRSLYRAYLAQSDVFVGIYWERYGWVAPGETVSGLEDEYLLSGSHPKLIYLKESQAREPRLAELLGRIESDDRASYKTFRTPQELADLLADDLALLLTERFAEAEAEQEREGIPRLRPGFLPAPAGDLIGRGDELAALGALLQRGDVRLVSITGPGGIGKSRLSLEVAARARNAGVATWFVELAPLHDAAAVQVAIAAAFGVRPEGSRPVLGLLADRLGTQRALIVLDSAEHVLSAATDIARLLEACPGVTVFVTSRTALRLGGEHEFPLPPLAIPSGATPGLDEAAASPAVALFVARSAQVRPGFALTAGNVADVAEICRRLDGIPLALELAAARMRLLTPAALRKRLDHRLDLAADRVDLPERHRTLRAAIEGSYEALDHDCRRLFARLSIFSNGWTLEAAEAVAAAPCDGDPAIDALESMSALVGASLVAVVDRPDTDPRFQLLDTVREYAAERLRESGQADSVMRNLADYLRELTEQAGPALRGPENRAWGRRIHAEVDDIRAVMRWALDTDQAELAVRLPAPLFTFWWAMGLLAEMLDFADETAVLPSAAQLPRDAAGLLLWCRGAVRVALGQVAEAMPLLRELVTLARELGDRLLLAHALTSLGLSVPVDTSTEEAKALLGEGLALYRAEGDAWGIFFALLPLGQVTLRDGDAGTAMDLHREALVRAEEIDSDHLRAQAFGQLGLDSLLLGDVDAGRNWFALAADVQRRLLDQEGLAYCLDGFSSVALLRGQLELAAQLGGAADATRTRVGVAVWPLLRPLNEALTARLEEALGPEAFARERASGAALGPSEALDYALASTGPAPS